MVTNESNAINFINAYNTIDQSLRAIYSFRRSITYSDLIRRCVPLNSIVRRYEDKLIDYGRLRNAIIHNSNEERIIAEPHDDVVIEMQRIAELISRPPLAITKIGNKSVLVLDSEVNVENALITMARTGFKTIPVVSNDTISGVLTAGRLADFIGKNLNNGAEINKILHKPVSSVTNADEDLDRVFTIKSKDLTIQEALDVFYKNRKMLAIILTKSGNYLEKPIGIITVADIMDMNKILEDYDL